MSTHEELPVPQSWRGLAVGDIVEITNWPSGLTRELMHQETVDIYELAIARRLTLKVHHIDSWGIPYGELVLSIAGDKVYHYLGLNHDCVSLVSKGGL